MTNFRWDDRLTGHPKRIAEVDHSPLRVLAGPGTGKTFALMRRVARLLQEGADPKRMLVCTFTRTAARDLQKELASLGVSGTKEVMAGTLHAFCFGLLSRADVLALTGRAPRPLLDYEQKFLIADMQDRAFGGVRLKTKRIKAFNAAWARLQSDDPGWPSDPIDQQFQRALLGWLRYHEAMLIGELVPEALRFLRENPASPHKRTFDHVLVDEYQDLNRSEQVLLDVLASTGTLTVIGDEDQSIYSFKYAHPEGIAGFHESHPGTHDEALAICRRCPKHVVAMANCLIACNTNRRPRTLRPKRTNPDGDIHIVQWPTAEDEAEGIAEYVRRRTRSGDVDAGQVLVLSPRRQFGYAIRDALRASDVHAHSFFFEEALDGDPKDMEKCAAQRSFTLLTLLADPDDRVALRCWCGFGSSSLRHGAWGRMRNHCERMGEDPGSALNQLASGRLSLAHTDGLASRYRVLQRRIRKLKGLAGQDLVDALFPSGEEWAATYRSLAAGIDESDFNAATLREALRIGIIQLEPPTGVDYVRVMSPHKAKGLTAEMVIVADCVEGLMPMHYDPVNTDLTKEQFEREQRRFFYVALTRTTNILVLSSIAAIPWRFIRRWKMPAHGGSQSHGSTIASRFLGELGSSRPQTVLGSSLI